MLKLVVPFLTAAAYAAISSTLIGSVVVTPMAYATYSGLIDYQLLRYTASGDAVFFDRNHGATNFLHQ